MRSIAMLALTLTTVLVAACGSDDEPSASTTPPANAIVCPGGEIDPNEIIGKSEAEAETAAKEKDCVLRVTERDGEGLPATMDLREERINVSVEDGKVKAILGTG